VQVDQELQPLPERGEAIGLDVGLTSFVVDSEGNEIENPRCAEQSSDKIAKLHKRVNCRRSQKVLTKGCPGAGPGRLRPAGGHARTSDLPLEQELQGEADVALAQAGSIKLQDRQEDLNVRQREEVKQTRKGSRTYT